MREILFKAKRLDNREWFEGVPVDVTPLTCFASDKVAQEVVMVRAGFADWGMPRGLEYTKVDPSTVCQYTGLTDKNGKKIFEGDIISIENPKPFAPWICKVVYENCCWWLDGQSRVAKVMLTDYADVEMEIIGSIHDGEGGQ